MELAAAVAEVVPPLLGMELAVAVVVPPLTPPEVVVVVAFGLPSCDAPGGVVVVAFGLPSCDAPGVVDEPEASSGFAGTTRALINAKFFFPKPRPLRTT